MTASKTDKRYSAVSKVSDTEFMQNRSPVGVWGASSNTCPRCEPQLGRHGVYARLGTGPARKTRELAMLWTLNLSDGQHSLLDIAERAELPFDQIKWAADLLMEHQLLTIF